MLKFALTSRPGPKNPAAVQRSPPIAGLRIGVATFACLGLNGCKLGGAPTYSLFGAYFPAWLLCAAVGVFGSILLRSLLIATNFEEAIPLKLLVYCAFALGLSLWLWLALFGES